MELVEFGLQPFVRINETLHVRHINLINFFLVYVLSDLTVLIRKKILGQVGGPVISFRFAFLLLILRPLLPPLLFLKLLLVYLFFHLSLGDELVEKLLRPEPKVHQHRVNCAKRNTKVLLIEGDRDVFVNSIANVSYHELLESYRLELDLLLDVFQRVLEGELLGASVIEEV